jgi:hypothetical protein
VPPVFPTAIIKNTILDGNGIGVYLGYGATTGGRMGLSGGVAILDSIFLRNGEAVRLVGAPSVIRGNEFRQNYVGIKIQNWVVADGRLIEHVIGPNEIALNNFRENVDFAVLNLTQTPLDLNHNFWGDAAGPAAGEITAAVAAPLVLIGLWYRPSGFLSVAGAADLSGLIRYAGELALSLTLSSLSREDLGAPLIFSSSTVQASDARQRVRGPALLQSWLEDPVETPERRGSKEKKDDSR